MRWEEVRKQLLQIWQFETWPCRFCPCGPPPPCWARHTLTNGSCLLLLGTLWALGVLGLRLMTAPSSGLVQLVFLLSYKKTQETLSQAGQKTSAALSTVGSAISRKLGDMR